MRFVLLALLVAACRTSDGHTQNTPPLSDSARAEELLRRADVARIQGDSGAKVWMVEISDFQCPFCKQWHDETYPIIQREYVKTGRLRLAYINLPLQQHAHAQQAAEAAMCAGAQEHFWPMHDSLFATQTHWGPLSLAAATAFFDSLAVSVGVNHDAWRDCVRGDVIPRIIGGDRSRSIEAGVRSTPTFFVGSERIEGAAPIAVFRAAIERASAAPARP